MNPVDQLKINFNSNELLLLNICLGFLMFSISLDIRRSDFEALWRSPRAALLGLFAQLVLMPALTVGLIYLFQPPTSVALGMVLVAGCPGGNISNFATNLAKGNTALAITTTSLSTLLAVVTTPLIFALGSMCVPNVGALKQEIYISPLEMVKIVATLMLFPLVLGMVLHQHFPLLIARIRRSVKILSLLIFFSFIIGALIANWDNLLHYVGKVFWLVLLLNGSALALGYFWARLNRLSIADARAITFETGIHNTALGLILIFNFFHGLGGMALVAAWYGIWDMVTALLLGSFWGKERRVMSYEL
jgi:bile acid:Na+ symporter, BASS family